MSDKKKCLFICTRSPDEKVVKSGGLVLTKANFQALSQDFEMIIIPSLKAKTSIYRKFVRLIWSVFGYLGGNSPWFTYKVKSAICKRSVDLVFIEHSQLGRLASLIRRHSNAEVMVSFHNVETDYIEKSADYPSLIKKIMIRAAQANESLALKHAHKVICLTNEDSHEIKRRYGRSADLTIPITVNVQKSERLPAPYPKPYYLFCGTNFPPNTRGLRWFVEAVLSDLPHELVVVGYEMQSLKTTLSHPKLRIVGTVDDLRPYYQNALAVVNPVSTGAGMNTKSVEAVASGKILVATAFATIGFPRPLPRGIYICDTASDFVKALSAIEVTEPPQDEILDYARTHFSLEARRQLLGASSSATNSKIL